eukprot:TRINITY_DN17869_c0_g2_i1.p1 TRINITY_DN17869_c0_g2~~TRINITY_DN17869_c0_g2_i1.p1  ORF type:complete len:1111 (-),score=197.07 TRINITY_DN17869_c0_g2_i1:41-3373(-)
MEMSNDEPPRFPYLPPSSRTVMAELDDRGCQEASANREAWLVPSRPTTADTYRPRRRQFYYSSAALAANCDRSPPTRSWSSLSHSGGEDASAASRALSARVSAILRENAELRARVEELEGRCCSGDGEVSNKDSSMSPASLSFSPTSGDRGGFTAFAQGLSAAGIDIYRPGAEYALRELHGQLQRGESRICCHNGKLLRRHSVVRVFLLAKIHGEERLLIEHVRFSGNRQFTVSEPLELCSRDGENWQETAARGLETMVGLPREWQAKHITIDEQYYTCSEEKECSSILEVVGLPMIVQVHEVHAVVTTNLEEDDDQILRQIGLPSYSDFVVRYSCGENEGNAVLKVWCWKPREYEMNMHLKQFRVYLEEHGVDVSQFGHGDNKTLFHFYVEAKERKLCTLQERPCSESGGGPTLSRVVSILKIRLLANVHNRTRVLSQTEEYLEDGRKRAGSQMLVKKMRDGEDWRLVLKKAIDEKLGVPAHVQEDCFFVDEDRVTYTEDHRPSENYAGIDSKYKVWTVTVAVIDPDHTGLEVIGLPRGNDFVTKETVDGLDGCVELHVWTWAPAAEEEAPEKKATTALEEMSRDLHEVEQVVFRTASDSKVISAGLDTALRKVLQKIKNCAERLIHIDQTLAVVDVSKVMGEGAKRGSVSCNPQLKDFITSNYTRTNEAIVVEADSEEESPCLENVPMELLMDIEVISKSLHLETIRDGQYDWNLDLFEINEQSSMKIIESYAEIALVPTCRAALNHGKDALNVRGFVSIVASHYYANPYHNAVHAVQVCHLVRWLVTAMGVRSRQKGFEHAALVIAALCHDVKHIGRNNAFCVNTEHPLALRYNNHRVLESMHSATCLELLQQSEMLKCLSVAERSNLRSHIIEYILATDMKDHFEEISKLCIRRDADDLALNSEADRRFVSKMCLKAGDLGHGCLSWTLHQEWSTRVCQEFFAQGDEEHSLGLPLSPLCDRSTVDDIAKSQKGFLSFVCLPLMQALTDVQALLLVQKDEISNRSRNNSRHPTLGGVGSEPAASSSASHRNERQTSWVAPNWDRQVSMTVASIVDADSGQYNVQAACVDAIKDNEQRWWSETEDVEKVKGKLREPLTVEWPARSAWT